MELPGFEYSALKISLELKLIKFYYEIFLEEFRLSTNTASLDTLNAVKNAYSIKTIKSGIPDMCFQSPETRCAYIYQYAPCFSSAVAYHFHKLLKRNPWMFEKVILQDTVTICCLGGGPATELAAVAKILEEMMWTYCPRSQTPMKIDATVIDIDSGWRVTAEKVIQYFPNLIDTSLMKFSLTFIEADVTKPLTSDVQNAIKKSDFVTMVKFLSSVHGENRRDNISQTLQELIQCISEGGTLFFLDSSGFQHYDVLRNVMRSFGKMSQIYGNIGYDMYRLSYPTLNECFRLYCGFYGFRYCAQQAKNYVSAWQKRA